MPQEARSSTPSTQWSTYKLDTPVQFVKGVGPRLSTIFAKHNIKTVKDLLTFFPRTYEDRSEFVKIAQLRVGQKATLRLKILYTKKIPIRSRPKPLFEAICSDGYQTISLKFFNPYHGIETQFTKNREITVSGVAKINYSHFDHFDHFEMLHPEIIWDQATNINVGRIIPIYIEIENLSNRLLRKILWEAIQKFSSAFTEDLPIEILKKHSLPQLSQAIQMIH
ncbi:MAG: hypothetical protein HY843_00350, partial [Bdellovibrio sp.]|nr:hypothetical protein [Bdellovibrio sp.]